MRECRADIHRERVERIQLCVLLFVLNIYAEKKYFNATHSCMWRVSAKNILLCIFSSYLITHISQRPRNTQKERKLCLTTTEVSQRKHQQ